ncbi:MULTISPECIES: hypothetical protein [Planomicrobium]|uniref:hypothetical protein n=1 Tax=Planomicrobium TaxID=162291 RepID=UPI000C7A0B9A|nr:MULTISPECIES: hypothetical protein [Planomicrobium]PKH08576.1 hypothetical protein CXF70_16545 [Planomicrobium sp. MB-3u-38]
METPFGQLEIRVYVEDGEEVEADVQVIEQKIDEPFPVGGRYLIEVRVTPLKKQLHIFTIRFTPSKEITDAYIETGEHLELKSWISGNFKWSLGVVDEDWLRALRNVNLKDVEYLDDGISLKIDGIPAGEEFVLPFGVAWKEMQDRKEEEHHTWYAAAPADMYPPKWLQQEEK